MLKKLGDTFVAGSGTLYQWNTYYNTEHRLGKFVEEYHVPSCYIIVLFLILPSNCHNSNMTSVLDIRDEHHTTTKYLAFIFITVFLLYGIVSNLIMAITFCVQESIFNHAFILISLQLIISNFVLFLLDTAVILPEILRNKNISEVHQTTLVTHVFSFLKSFSIFSALHFTFLLTLNRFVIQILPKYNSFFESLRLHFLLSFVWLSVFAITTADFYYCTVRYNASNLRWKRICTKQIRYAWITFLPVAMFVMYIAIFCSIRHRRHFISDINQTQSIYAGSASNTASTGSYERVMLIQAALICGALESTILISNFLPSLVLKVFGQKAILSLSIFINCYAISSRTALPTVYFIYNKQARKIIKNFFLRLHSN
uniref:G_PROTEIN_RECEP_F1_2 domain-containing protein n=1 Tax=Onchocerca volvulus TaxID=6282 RepID=A0A8R1TMI1_ONCVO